MQCAHHVRVVHVHVCECVCARACMHVCVCSVGACVCVHVYVCSCMYVCMHACMCVYVCVYVCLCTMWPEEDMCSPRTGVMNDHESFSGCWKPNLGFSARVVSTLNYASPEIGFLFTVY